VLVVSDTSPNPVHSVKQGMSPRLAALIKKIENGNAELSTEVFRARGEKQDD
jgi:hypothetical protein